MNEEEATIILEKINQEKIRSSDFVEYHTKRMYAEFGGKWDNKKARQYINAVASEENMRQFADYTTEEVDTSN